MTCRSCGAEVPEGSRFCPACGHELVARPDERRLATVLFADLVGFTAFSESADPEAVKRLLDTCFARLVADLESFGGHVDKIVGDAIVALFGAPVAHEDDPERAVRAALCMQASLATLRKEHAIDAELRIGVNTGEVIVGSLRADGTYTALGDVVNSASRLQVAARPGTVVVGPQTYAATSSVFHYHALGALAVKGRDAPIDSWVAGEALAPPGQRPRRRGPLLGRDLELDAVCSVLGQSFARRRVQLVVITGGAGIGKTRLATEVAARLARTAGASTFIGHCIPYGEAAVWAPITEVLGEALGIEPTDHLAERRARCRSVVESLLGPEPEERERLVDGLLFFLGAGIAAGVDPTRARDEASRALEEVFGAMARRAPVLLCLADFHLADDDLLALVDRLLRGLREVAFAVVATGRSELRERLGPPAGRHNRLMIELDPLDADASAALARRHLGPSGTPALVDEVVARAGGNPFFIEELAAMLADPHRPEGARFGEVPATLRGVLAARLDRLEPAGRALIDDCAVIGTRGPSTLVEALAAGHGEHDVSARLRELADADLLELRDDGYAFTTDLVRDTVYSTLTKAERARRHAAVVELLAHQVERDETILDAVLAPLSHHYAATMRLSRELGDVDGVPHRLDAKASTFLERALERAEAQEDWSTTRTLLDMALALRPGVDEQLDLLLRRAAAAVAMRDLAETRRDLDRAARLLGDEGSDEAHARWLATRAELAGKESDPVAALARFGEAVAAWRALGDTSGLAATLRARGFTNLFAGDHEAAQRDVTEALGLYEQVGDRRGAAWALQYLALIAFLGGDLVEAEARLDGATRTFEDVKDWGGLVWAHGLLAWIRFGQGRLDEAEQLARRLRASASPSSDPWLLGLVDALLAGLLMWRGHPAAAIELAEPARLAFAELGDRWAESIAITPLAHALTCVGRLPEAVALTREHLAPDGGPGNEPGPGTGLVASWPLLLLTKISTHAGHAGALAEVEAAPPAPSPTFAIELAESRALALLQAGRASESLAALAEAVVGEGERRPSNASIHALALVAAGQPEAGLAAARSAERIAASYLDGLIAVLARLCALHRLGRADERRSALEELRTRVEATESPLDRAIVALAAAAVTDDPGARAAARSRFAGLGLDAAGWERLLESATGVDRPPRAPTRR